MSSEDHYQHRDSFRKLPEHLAQRPLIYKEVYPMVKYPTIQSLPDELFCEVYKRYRHAEIEGSIEIVYTERSLLEIINFIFENYGRV